MADLPADIDGSLSLEDTKNACLLIQNDGFELESIEMGTVTQDDKVLLVNKAQFKSKPTGRLKHLLFVPVGTTDPQTLKDQKVKVEKWTFICDKNMYVSDVVTRVMVFGKKKL
jgi:hypothetical protein